MNSPAELRRSASRPDAEIVRVAIPSPELNRFFYTAIGGDWFWLDRLPWTYDDWKRYLERPELQTWLVTVGGVPAGYFELRDHQDGSVEIAYFGLLPEYVGRGWGGHLLTRAVETAWQRRPTRVWLHTCTLDHPAALPNYLRRGFRPVREESYTASLPER